MEEGVLWTVELRLDNVDDAQAGARDDPGQGDVAEAGVWVYTLGGWSPDQFTDDKRPFSQGRARQGGANHPVLLQFTRAETYLNSRAVEVLGLAKRTDPWIKRDASGQPTGVLDAWRRELRPCERGCRKQSRVRRSRRSKPTAWR